MHIHIEHIIELMYSKLRTRYVTCISMEKQKKVKLSSRTNKNMVHPDSCLAEKIYLREKLE